MSSIAHAALAPTVVFAANKEYVIEPVHTCKQLQVRHFLTLAPLGATFNPLVLSDSRQEPHCLRGINMVYMGILLSINSTMYFEDTDTYNELSTLLHPICSNEKSLKFVKVEANWGQSSFDLLS